MQTKLVLLVEDNPDDAALTLRAFKQHNLANRIEVVRDGAQALEFLFGSAAKPAAAPLPQLVLLDLKLPKVEGLEVLRRIRADERTRLLPVVILTTSREEGDRLQGYLLGANAYVCKPVDFNEFVEAVKTLGLFWLLLNEPPPLPAKEPDR